MLKTQNNDRAAESTEIAEKTQAVRAEISSKDTEINQLNAEIQGTITENQITEREIESLKMSCNEQQEIRSRQ